MDDVLMKELADDEIFKIISKDDEIFKIISKIHHPLKQPNCVNLSSPDRLLDMCSRLEQTTFLILFPILLFVCFFSNFMNIVIYNVEYLRKSVAVKLLTAKALFNTLFMISLIPDCLKIAGFIERYTVVEVYWDAYPYLVTITNVAGTTAMWITVLMTLERYLCVVFPIQSKIWCGNGNFYKALASACTFSLLIQFVYPVTRTNRKATKNVCGGNETTVEREWFVAREANWIEPVESIHHWVVLLFAIILPLALLIFMSFVVAYRLLWKRTEIRGYNERKRCVTHITMSTTVAQVLLELPSVPIFVQGALKGAQTANRSEAACMWKAVATGLAMLNASVLFFIYLIFSQRFRHLFLFQITCGWTGGREETEIELTTTVRHSSVAENDSLRVIQKNSVSTDNISRNNHISRVSKPSSHQRRGKLSEGGNAEFLQEESSPLVPHA